VRYPNTMKYWLPLLFLLALAPISGPLDMALAHYAQSVGTTPFFQFLFDWGPFPALLTTSLASLAVMGSYLRPQWKKWRFPALVLVGTMAIGAGVIVHAVLKDHWGRPRPRQVLALGGDLPFRPFYSPDFHAPKLKSFPCGHCAMGAFFLAVGVLGTHYRRKKWALAGYSFGLFFWALLGIMRMAMEGHFLTDVLWAGAIMWWTALCLEASLSRLEEQRESRKIRHQ